MAMLTPNKIKGYQFQQAGRGTYRADEVDDFLNQIVESYEQVFKENGELVKKLSILATKLDEYRKEETSVRKALVNAQTFIDKMIDDANKESKKIIAEAESRAQNVDSITNAKIKVMVDEVEGKMRIAYEKATSQAKQTKENAHKEAETLILEAHERADKMIAEAKLSASEILEGANKEAHKEAELLKAEIEKEKEILDNLKATSNQFKTELVVLYERQLKNVEQMPDYKLDSGLEEKVKKIVEEKKSEEKLDTDEKAVEEIVDGFVKSDDDYFDADDLIREYAVKDKDEKYNSESFDLKISDDDEEAESSEEKDEFEDIFSDSGSSEGFRFTAEDFDDISREITEREDEDFAFSTEDVDFFTEKTENEDIPVSKPERKRTVDIAFSDDDAVKISKDEDMFLSQKEETKRESGFKFFDNIDMSDDETFDIESSDEVETDDIFGKSEDDDVESFSFLKNIFGKNNN